MSPSKISVLESINEYRDCARSLWNGYFMKRFESEKNWCLVDSFNIIKEELFHSIVLFPVLNDSVTDFSLGIPSQWLSVTLANKTPVQVNRNNQVINNVDFNNAGYWDHPITQLSSGANLSFVNLFDWNEYGFLDMSLVIAQIEEYTDHPELIGHRVIVELRYTDILVNCKNA